MSDYTELVKALRHCAKGGCDDCSYLEPCLKKWQENKNRFGASILMIMDDAAAAIEELQAEVEKWQDVAYQDSLKQMEQQERIWELEALKEAHIKPSYGEWLTVEVNPLDRMNNPIYECTCSRCHEEYTLATIPNYCPNCGSFNKAKMEVQE